MRCEARVGRSAGWFAEKLISGLGVLVVMVRGDVVNGWCCLSGYPGCGPDVSLIRIGRRECRAGVSCALYDLELSGTERHDSAVMVCLRKCSD